MEIELQKNLVKQSRQEIEIPNQGRSAVEKRADQQCFRSRNREDGERVIGCPHVSKLSKQVVDHHFNYCGESSWRNRVREQMCWVYQRWSMSCWRCSRDVGQLMGFCFLLLSLSVFWKQVLSFPFGKRTFPTHSPLGFNRLGSPSSQFQECACLPGLINPSHCD